MSDNALKIIKDELARIDKVRNNTVFVPKEKWSLEDDSKTIDCPECGNEVESQGYVIKSADEHQAVDIHLYGMEKICKPQAEFIALAANEITKLTKSLSVAVQTFEAISCDNIYVGENGWRDEHFLDVKQAQEAITNIANILAGKDGK